MTDIPTTPPETDRTEPIDLNAEMQRSYIEYAMSVIVSRALPDVRDGLKPVHRRIVYAMYDGGYRPDRGYNKCSRVVGDVMGQYHPHGDSAIYDAMVRLVQPWSLRYPLIDGQGNFGSAGNDGAAAPRYTECKMAPLSLELVRDIDQETVDFVPNYDGKTMQPDVLPARFPNLLANGSAGIAVGMATNIPPHNLVEVVNGAVAIMENPAIDLIELMQIIPGPDFPTSGIILGQAGIRQAFETGRGSVMMRGKVHVEPMRNDREAIIITEVPYQVNKATMIEKMAELVRDKRIEGISDLRDESDRQGYRVVVELKRDVVADVIINQLYRYTPLQTSFGVNMVALNGGKPELMNLIDMLKAFVAFRENVITRRTKYLLRKARERAHVLVGLAIAVANIDEVIALIRKAPDPATAREQLMTRRWPAKDVEPLILLIDDPRHRINEEDGTYNLSEEQARAILELRLARLTALGRDEIGDELGKIGDEIKDFLEILASRTRVQQIVKDELIAVRDEFGVPRRTQITEGGADMDDEDLIAREDMVVTVSHAGYIKRVPLATYRAQRRGGKGRSGMSTRDEDFVTRLFVANTHTPVLFFSSRGIVYKEKVWRLPIGTPTSKGKALINMLPLEKGERITSIMPLPEDESSWGELDVMFATTRGTVRRNKLSDFVQVNRNGKIAMKLDSDGDEILNVETCNEFDDVLLTTALGQCIRFSVDDVRVFAGRNSVGVRGINLAEGDHIISMTIVHHVDADPSERAAYLKRAVAERRAVSGDEVEDIALVGEEAVEDGHLDDERYEELKAREQFILTVSEKGYGKRSSSYEFRTSGRGGKGIRATDTSKTGEIGPLIAAFPVEQGDQIMMVSDGGQVIRVPVGGIRMASRATKGVTIFSTATDERVVSVDRISEPEHDEELHGDGIEGDVTEAAVAPDALDDTPAPDTDETPPEA
jgi:DNA gyrase subunit A